MEDALHHFLLTNHWAYSAIVLIVSILILGKGADLLVDNAVDLSAGLGVPKFVIATTIVSLGTTLPEVAVSVMAAIDGNPGLALGNAVGSIICDTGLIMGICCLIGKIPTNGSNTTKGTWYQIGSAVLLIALTLPWVDFSFDGLRKTGGNLPQWGGYILLVALVAYIFISLRRPSGGSNESSATKSAGIPLQALGILIGKILVAALIVVISSQGLIAAAIVIAENLGIPDSVIAATLIALGTSFPELVTSVAAVLKNHGEIAIGNVVGADVLNALFVAGAAAAITPAGLEAAPQFLLVLFPAMLFILIVFKVGVSMSKDTLPRPFGVILLLIYAAALGLSYI